VTSVPELFLTAVKLSHDNTGARYLHLAREDTNNLFSIQTRNMKNGDIYYIHSSGMLCGQPSYFCELQYNERIFSQHLQNRLLPDHTYSVVSGGDPLCIPELTWEQLKQFHATHYHPSNARFFTYGNFPLEQHLKQIHEEALNKFQKIEPSTSVPAQKPWEKPREFQITCGPDSFATDPFKQTTVSVSFLLPDITDTFEAFTLSLLSSLLIAGPNSPFYKALIESGLGTDFSPDVGYNGYTREAYFSVGLQGIAEQDTETVRTLVDRTVDEVIEKGFEDDRIEALLHKLEIQMKHQSTSFGLTLTSYIASCWNHDGDPVELLQLGGFLVKFRQCLKDNPKFLQEKVKQYFKDNQHKLTLSMKPDDKYHEKQAQMEAEKLKQMVGSLSPKDKQLIYEKGLELRTEQSKPQDASCLPALKVSDIEPTMPVTELHVVLAGGDTPVQYCAQPTNGVVYFRAFCSLDTLPEELRPYVPLFCSVLTNPRFEEEERFRVLVRMTAQELSNGIPDSGHLYASIRASRTLTPAGDLQETFGGMDQVRLMKSVAEMADVTPVLRKLPRIKEHLLNRDNMRCSVNAAPQQLSRTEQAVGNFLGSLGRPHVVEKPVHNGPDGSTHVCGSQIVRKLITDPSFKPCQMKTHFLLPFPVNYVGECIRTVPYTDPDHASLKILARLMTAKFLHTEIREKGGAYGGGAKLSHSGVFTLYSYRDPNSVETLQAFGKAVDWAKSGKFTQQDIDEAKLSVFASVDAPVAPSDKGMDHFLYGLSDERKQAHRERLFAVSHDSLVAVSHAYLGTARSTHGWAILGPENAKIAEDPSWITR
uniref:Pitrilysin metalloproteinase 1 n=1 Tax=Propithecus coquereli TaxID=379532 RepID=A0A2K6GNI0_PROCO